MSLKMKQKSIIIWCAVAFMCLFSRITVNACTAFMLKGKAYCVVGFNENDKKSLPGMIVTNKRGVAKEGLSWNRLVSEEVIKEPKIKWTSRYGSVSFNLLGIDMPCYGVNEKGLFIVELYLDKAYSTNIDGRANMWWAQWIQYQLDNYASVKEVIKALKSAPVIDWWPNYSGSHFFVSDKNGATAAIELIDGKYVVSENGKMPVLVLCNGKYQEDLTALRQYAGFGGTANFTINTQDWKNRFCNVAHLLRNYQAAQQAVNPVEYSWNVLNDNYPGIWQFVYDVNNGALQFRSDQGRGIKELDMSAIDFSYKTPIMYLDIHADFSGKALPRFSKLTPEVNKQYASKGFLVGDADNTFAKSAAFSAIQKNIDHYVRKTYNLFFASESFGQGKTTPYTNPVMWADAPDLSITRNGDEYYLISTTMHLMPGAPIMKSKDLVHWEIVSYVFNTLNDNSKYDLLNGTVYGRGQWASSIRYHNGKYYVLFSPNDEPFRSYLYSATDPSKGWTFVNRLPHFHDNSLFFDDDGRVYVFYGTGQLRELKADLSDVEENGVNMKIFERDATETNLLEGSQAIKYNGKYYLLMISWPQNAPRRQVCYRADHITGPYEKKVILEDNFAGFPYAGQGCIIDDINGNWHALIFQDRGAIGRVPLLMPVRWEDGWPMLGDDNGRVPLTATVALESDDTGKRIVESDDFSKDKLKLNWQWNHNPVNEAWSLTERAGYLRLKTSRVVENLFLAPNTISQRMEGPRSKAVISIDVSKMKEGDVCGFAAFNGNSGLLSVVMEDGKKYIAMSTQVVHLTNQTKAVTKVDTEEKERVTLDKEVVYLRIDTDFNLNKDWATFFYSYDNKTWRSIGEPFKMIFDYRRLFMGTRFALFNYATASTGGYVDVDFFDYLRYE